MKELVIASNNLNKIKEYQTKLKNISLIPYKQLVKLDIVETGKTFKENALKKAKTISQLTNKPCLGDDSGLIVEALPKQLGVFSKRFSRNQTTKDNNELLLNKLVEATNRKAKFITVICLYIPGKKPRFYHGELNGKILREPRGKNGFGYDPLFYVKSKDKTLAELSLNEKNKLSHRAKAIEKLIKDLEDENYSIF